MSNDPTPSGEVLFAPLVLRERVTRDWRFWAWVSAALMTVSVLIALVVLVQERNNLRSENRAQALELTCRAEAGVEVAKAEGALLTAIGLGLSAVAVNDDAALVQAAGEIESTSRQLTRALVVYDRAVSTTCST
jgi:ABC-type tungstate transport system substrate-binding protein